MEYKINETIKDYNNRDVLGADGATLTWRDVVFYALNTPGKSDTVKNSKQRAYEITSRCFQPNNKVNLDIQDAAFVLECIHEVYDEPLICGRAKEFFNITA